jgi:hypothetical protein
VADGVPAERVANGVRLCADEAHDDTAGDRAELQSRGDPLSGQKGGDGKSSGYEQDDPA